MSLQISSHFNSNPAFFDPVKLPAEKQEKIKDLKIALFSGDIASVENLLASNPTLLSHPLQDGELPLHAAVRLKKYEIASYMISRNGNPFLKDHQGMTPIDYAFVNRDDAMLRILLPTIFLHQIESVQRATRDFQPASGESVENTKSMINEWLDEQKRNIRQSPVTQAILYDDLQNLNHLIGTGIKITQDDLTLSLLNGNPEIINLLLDCNPPGNKNDNNRSITPIFAAAFTQNSDALHALVKQNGDLFKTNRHGVSPADLLLQTVDRTDPLHLDKVQLILGLISLGSILSGYLSNPVEDPASAYLWQSGIALLSLGTQAAISYQAYLQLNPKNIVEKVLYLGTALAGASASFYPNALPGARVIWDVWRTGAVAKRALRQLTVAYNNFEYEPLRAAKLAGNELLSGGTTLYHTLPSIKQAFSNLTHVLTNFSELETLHEDQQTVSSMKEELEKKNLDLQEKQKKYADLGQKENEFKKREQDFEKMKSTWEKAETDHEKIPVCKAAYAEDLNKAKEHMEKVTNAFIKKITHPTLPFLLSPKSDMSFTGKLRPTKEQFESAICALFAENVKSETGIYTSTITSEAIKKAYRELALLYHPDHCGKKGTPLYETCNVAYLNLGKAKDLLLEKFNQMPSYVQCVPPKISFDIAKIEICTQKTSFWESAKSFFK